MHPGSANDASPSPASTTPGPPHDDAPDAPGSERDRAWETMRAALTGAGSALVVVLAFLLPGVQDQYDRWQSRRVIDAYAEVGRELQAQGRYANAEDAFLKALELSEGRRLDLERDRLAARVHRLLLQPAWGAPNPDSLEEADFRSLLVLQRRAGDTAGAARTQALLADFLAGEGRLQEGLAFARAAVRQDSAFARGWVSLGNALSEAGDTTGAERAYARAMALDSASVSAAYDMALLRAAKGDGAGAISLLRRAAARDPRDTLVLAELEEQLRLRGDSAQADRIAILLQRERNDARRRALRRRAPSS